MRVVHRGAVPTATAAHPIGARNAGAPNRAARASRQGRRGDQGVFLFYTHPMTVCFRGIQPRRSHLAARGCFLIAFLILVPVVPEVVDLLLIWL